MIKKPVSKIVMLLLILSVIILGTGFVFADSTESIESSINDIVVPMTLQANAVQAATTHTIDDIYNLLWYFFSSPSNLGPSYDTYFSYNGVYLSEIQTIIYQELQTIDADINSGLSSVAYNTDLTNRKLEYVFSAVEDIINIKWYSTEFGYAGFNIEPNGQFIDHNTTGNDFYFAFNYNASINDTVPSLYRVFVPCVIQDGLNLDTSSISVDLKIIIPNVGVRDFEYNGDYFVENTKNGLYIYLYNMRWPLTGQYYVGVHSDHYLNAYVTYEAYIVSIPFDTIDYQLIKEAFNSTSASAASKALDALASIYASEDVAAAKAAQQDYETETLQDFTGSGSGAATKSDKNKLKSTSGALKSGLDSGGSIDNSLDAFNTSNSLWDWFTQPVQDSLDTVSNTYLDIPFTYSPTATKIQYNSGTASSTTGPFSNFSATRYIDIHLYDSLVYSRANYPGSTNGGFAFYDSNQIFISSGQALRNNQTTGYTLTTISVPSNAYYARFTFYKESYFPGAVLRGRLRYDNSLRSKSISNSNKDDIINFIDINLEDIYRGLNNGKSGTERR